MSTASKVTLAVTTAVTLGIIYGVHTQQVEDRAKLRQGIARDIERQKLKSQNLEDFHKTQEIEKLYREARLAEEKE